MKEHSILFSGPLVRAILDGQKTVTRRPLPTCRKLAPQARCPFGAVGDRLWVRETWGDADIFYQEHTNDVPAVVAYRADKSAIQYNSNSPRRIPEYDRLSWNWDAIKWRPSIHMPRWACRLLLEVVSVRFERLQDITDDDAKAEGVEFTSVSDVPRNAAFSCRDDFAQLWDKIYKGTLVWRANPLVWRVEFRKVGQ